jgi:hypothetical protein
MLVTKHNYSYTNEITILMEWERSDAKDGTLYIKPINRSPFLGRVRGGAWFYLSSLPANEPLYRKTPRRTHR